MTIFRRLPILIVLFGLLALASISLQGQTAHAQPVTPSGSCGDTVSDDAHLFGSRTADVLNQAKAMNDSLRADTRVVTVSQSRITGSSLRAYYNYILSQCPNWGGTNAIILVMAPGNEPFLHLGDNFSSKMTAADFQQMTLSIQSEFNSGNYAQSALDLLKQVQQKLTPNYTWLWVILAVVVIVVAGAVAAGAFLRRRQAGAAIAQARENAIQAKQAAVNAISPLNGKIDELSPRIAVLQALVPPATASQLSGFFENAKQQVSRVQENLGNLLSNPDTNPTAKTLNPQQYTQIQHTYQEVYNEAQEPQYMLNAVETAVQRLERNPQEPIDFRQLSTQAYI